MSDKLFRDIQAARMSMLAHDMKASEKILQEAADEISRLRAKLERARERLHTISLSARDKTTKRMAIDALRELDQTGGGDE